MLYTNKNNTIISRSNNPNILPTQLVAPISLITPLRPNRQGQIRIADNDHLLQTQQQPLIPYKDQMKWGEPTWTLFHVLVEKVKPEYFTQIRRDLLDIISSICANLQCPDCAAHATAYLATVNFNIIQTQEQLRYMLYTFHNTVNARKSVPLFEIEQLNVYKHMNTGAVIHRFMYFFEIKYTTNMRMMPNGFARKQQAHKLKMWFDKNITVFN